MINNISKNKTIYPMFQAILAAVLFGASAPVAKLLLGEIEPVPMAALLYLGSGIGLLAFQWVRGFDKKRKGIEAGLSKTDIPWLLGAVFCGGVVAPIILMFSLRVTSAATTSLLFNFEGVATTLIAVMVFKEALAPKIWVAIGSITLASIILSWNPSGGWGFSIGALGVLGACVLWGMDNNFTRNISAKDPLVIVTFKGLGAGGFSLLLAFVTGSRFPGFYAMIGAMVLGCLSYGISIIFFILAMRDLGAARTSAFYGTAPFMGVLFSLFMFRDFPTIHFYIALPFMIFGTYLILYERHEHIHHHHTLEHEHRHRHDDSHHNHTHNCEKVVEEHSHVHVHEEMKHDHPHNPDIHHRHEHRHDG